MKLAHTIGLRVFCDGTDEQDVKESLAALLSLTGAPRPLSVTRTGATGVHDNIIVILEATIEKDAHIREFLDQVMGRLGEDDLTLLNKQLPTRIDEELNLFLRFDKEAWMKEQQLRVTEAGTCFHLTIKLAVFPKKREKALALAAEILKKPGKS